MKPSNACLTPNDTNLLTGNSTQLSTRSSNWSQELSRLQAPRWGLALLQALQVSRPQTELLEQLTEDEWYSLLRLCDASQLTLTLGAQCRATLPPWVADRIESNYRDNRKRFERLRSALLQIAERFESCGIDFVVLKGFEQPSGFSPDPLLRTQGDIDLWCRPETLAAAERELLKLGYRPVGRSKGRHLAPMIKEQSWQWRGNYFDPDLPIPVDLHFSLWDHDLEQMDGPPEPDFWERRQRPYREGHKFPVLADADALSFAALHLLMHTLHGDVRLQRAWEIAQFLECRSTDSDFWNEWKMNRSSHLRRLECVMFTLVSIWFGSALPEALGPDVDSLPAGVKLWLEKYALSPIEALFVPNKSELWLNLELVNSWLGKMCILRRRLLPLSMPSALSGTSSAGSEKLKGQRSRLLEFVAVRLLHHAAILIPTLLEGLGWFGMRTCLKSSKY